MKNPLSETVSRAFGNQGERGRLIYFYTDPLSCNEAKDAIRAIGGYNNFSPMKVNQAITTIAIQAPQARVRVAREFSPCLYLNGLGSMSKEALRLIFKDCAVDELNATEEMSSDLYERWGDWRLWWD